jgi:hypothetical protein
MVTQARLGPVPDVSVMSPPRNRVQGVGEPAVEDLELDEPLVHTQSEELFDEPRVASAGAPPLALYRRYRPDTFADVIGQEHVTEPL